MAAAAVNVFSLEVVVHPGERRSVTVEVLRAREAGPLVEMVEMQAGHQVGQQAWGIWNRGPVEKLAKASHVLVLLEKTVLPILRQRPLANPPRLLDALGYYADNLRLLSARVGGSFNRDAQLYCDRVDALVAEALALLEKLAKASHVLVLLEKTVLPILRQRPLANPPRLLDALGYYADNLRLLSARVGGSFNRDAQLYCDRVDALVAEALALLEKLAKASHVLVLLEKTVLPILRQRPLANPPRLLDALGYYADNLRLLSARVGGSFNRDAQLYCDRVDALVAEALAPPQLNLYAKIQEGIDALAHLARRLLDAPHTISQVAEEEGAADEEGAEEGAADEEGAEEGAADEE